MKQHAFWTVVSSESDKPKRFVIFKISGIQVGEEKDKGRWGDCANNKTL